MRPLTIGALVVVALAAFGAGLIVATPVGSGTARGENTVSVAELVREVQDSVVSIAILGDGLSQQAQAIGSGFVVDQDGHIITNFHVVMDAPKVAVQLADGTILPASVRGTDPANDLAVLRVEEPPEGLRPVTLGDSDAVEVGEAVIAIGSPLGLASTVTAGIVSALDRDELISPAQRPILGAIQTDASINPGSSRPAATSSCASTDLRRLIDEHDPGDTVTVDVLRGAEELSVDVTLDEWTPPGEQERASVQTVAISATLRGRRRCNRLRCSRRERRDGGRMRPHVLPVVLVVEDEEPIRRLITETLRQDGYQIVAVGSGDEALAELRRDGASFALVLLDVVMPGMSGEAVVREMRQDTRLRDLPVLLVTALASLADTSRVIEAGADAYLAKPFRIQELREVAAGLIRTHLRGDET